MVATVHIAVMFHDNSMTAFLGIDTDTWCHTHPTGKSGIKDIHEHFAHIVPNPFVEDIAEELSPFGRLNAIGSNGAVLIEKLSQMTTVGMVSDSLHHRTQLQELAMQLVAEECIKC